MGVEHLPCLGFYRWNVAHAKLHLNLPAEHKGTFIQSARTACLLYLCVHSSYWGSYSTKKPFGQMEGQVWRSPGRKAWLVLYWCKDSCWQRSYRVPWKPFYRVGKNILFLGSSLRYEAYLLDPGFVVACQVKYSWRIRQVVIAWAGIKIVFSHSLVI